MTDKEIIKALEYCASESIEYCQVCPYRVDMMYCEQMKLIADTLDLINRQQQDISTLKTKCYCISNNRDRIKKRLEIVSRDLQEGSSRLTEAEREKFWKTSDDEIREFWMQLYNYTVPENVKQVIPANMLSKLGHITKSTIDFINRQQEQLEAAANGQETLQKALAEKEKEIERLTAEKEQLIKVFGECQTEAVKDFAKAVIDGIDEGYISHSSDIVDFTTDYLRGKMAGDTE